MIKIEISKLGVVHVHRDGNMLLSVTATSAMRDALRFYADEKNWVKKAGTARWASNVDLDKGAKAREVAKDERNTHHE